MNTQIINNTWIIILILSSFSLKQSYILFFTCLKYICDAPLTLYVLVVVLVIKDNTVFGCRQAHNMF